ncbi:hypothetical protein DFH29DRAFT_1070536 [Suillus ampliporus]|nr:hypothetical protein DFH29DRAFT_1070536 [Suillus ampliporus]
MPIPHTTPLWFIQTTSVDLPVKVPLLTHLIRDRDRDRDSTNTVDSESFRKHMASQRFGAPAKDGQGPEQSRTDQMLPHNPYYRHLEVLTKPYIAFNKLTIGTESQMHTSYVHTLISLLRSSGLFLRIALELWALKGSVSRSGGPWIIPAGVSTYGRGLWALETWALSSFEGLKYDSEDCPAHHLEIHRILYIDYMYRPDYGIPSTNDAGPYSGLSRTATPSRVNTFEIQRPVLEVQGYQGISTGATGKIISASA